MVLATPAVLPGQVAAAAPAAPAAPVTNPAALVNPFVGTANEADAYPGPQVPFGMVQWSPDTTSQDDGGGYDYGDSRITGFSLTHLDGVGCKAEGDVPVLPTVGKVDTRATVGFRHSSESASAGYYRVGLRNGVSTQLTATTRTAMASFRFPSTSRAHLIFKLNGSQKPVHATSFHAVSKTEVRGSVTTGNFCQSANQYTIYFDMKFNHRFSTSGTFTRAGIRPGSTSLSLRAPALRAGHKPVTPGAPEGVNHPVYHGRLPAGRALRDSRLHGPAGAYLTFDTRHGGRTLLAKVGVSYVSTTGARRNLNAENPGWNFTTIRNNARATWNALLGKIQITGGNTTQQRIFYTALYHSFLFPSVWSDTNHQYRGVDGRVHKVDPRHRAFYTNISGWDIYRTQAQLEALLDPSVASDVAQSMVDDAHQSGRLPKWIEDNSEAYVMVGDPADPVLADYYAFGARQFNTSAALSAMVRQATKSSKIRPGGHYLAVPGYLPVDGRYQCCNYYGPSATTVEYDTADFAISAFAGALHNSGVRQRFVNRAQDWRNVLNSASGLMQFRNASGSWPGGFDPTVGKAWVEADSFIYTGMVPFNIAGLAAAKGGNAAMASYLNTILSSFKGAHGYATFTNEPSIGLPWEYDYIGQPWRTQQVVRQVVTKLWADRPSGLGIGNDDMGTMSAWYVWAALGLYPMTPGTSTLVMGSPLFPKAVISLPSATLTITGTGAAAAHPYVQSATWDGSAWNNAYAPSAAITSGGTLDFTLGATPNRSWASAPAAAPPSYGGNVVAPPEPRVGAVVSGLSSGLCMNVSNPVATHASPVKTWSCNHTGAQEWTIGTDGTIRELGRCLDVKSRGKGNGTPIDLYTCNGSPAQRWVGGSGGSLVNPHSRRCLNVSHASTRRGTALELFRCNGTKAQRWTLPAAPNPQAGAVVSGVSSRLCLDDTGGRSRSKTPVQLSTCNGTSSQRWFIDPDGTLRTHGLCLGVGGKGRSGAPVQLLSCDATNGRRWRATTSGQLISPQSNLCLTDPRSSRKAGTRLQVAGCSGAAGQRWTLPS